MPPDVGPVLANIRLGALRFMQPALPGDSIAVQLTVTAMTPRNEEYGEGRWQVSLGNRARAFADELQPDPDGARF